MDLNNWKNWATIIIIKLTKFRGFCNFTKKIFSQTVHIWLVLTIPKTCQKNVTIFVSVLWWKLYWKAHKGQTLNFSCPLNWKEPIIGNLVFRKTSKISFKKNKKQKGYWCYTQKTCSSSLFEGGVTFDIQFVSGYFKICQQDGSIKYTLILMNKAGEVKKNLSLAFLPASFWYATSFFVLFCFLLFLFLLCRCVLKVGNNNKIVSFPFWFTENVKLKSANFYLNR